MRISHVLFMGIIGDQRANQLYRAPQGQWRGGALARCVVSPPAQRLALPSRGTAGNNRAFERVCGVFVCPLLHRLPQAGLTHRALKSHSDPDFGGDPAQGTGWGSVALRSLPPSLLSRGCKAALQTSNLRAPANSRRHRPGCKGHANVILAPCFLSKSSPSKLPVVL